MARLPKCPAHPWAKHHCRHCGYESADCNSRDASRLCPARKLARLEGMVVDWYAESPNGLHLLELQGEKLQAERIRRAASEGRN